MASQNDDITEICAFANTSKFTVILKAIMKNLMNDKILPYKIKVYELKARLKVASLNLFD